MPHRRRHEKFVASLNISHKRSQRKLPNWNASALFPFTRLCRIALNLTSCKADGMRCGNGSLLSRHTAPPKMDCRPINVTLIYLRTKNGRATARMPKTQSNGGTSICCKSSWRQSRTSNRRMGSGCSLTLNGRLSFAATAEFVRFGSSAKGPNANGTPGKQTTRPRGRPPEKRRSRTAKSHVRPAIHPKGINKRLGESALAAKTSPPKPEIAFRSMGWKIIGEVVAGVGTPTSAGSRHKPASRCRPPAIDL